LKKMFQAINHHSQDAKKPAGIIPTGSRFPSLIGANR
jgi:hypothetical protein